MRLKSEAPLVSIAEDDRDILELVTVNLEGTGYRTAYALDGWMAWEAIKEQTPDVVLLDINMGGMDGFAVLKAMRGRWQTKKTPVIMMTAHGAATDVSKAVELGASDYLAKPFDNKVMLQRVARAARFTRLGAPVAEEPTKSDDNAMLL